MILRLVLLIVLAGSALAGAEVGGPPVDGPKPGKATPNVLFITVDDLRPALGCYGDTRAKTPVMDKLAREGVLFQRAYVQESWCSPSRTSVLTGLRPQSTRVYDLETHFRAAVPEVVTLPQTFRRHGYHAAALGKVYHDTQDDAASWDVPTWTPSAPVYALPENRARAQGRKGYAAPVEAADVPDDAYPDGQVATESIRRLRAYRAGTVPFFLCVGFYRPHLPFTAPKRYWDLHPRDAVAPAERAAPPAKSPADAFLRWAEHHNYDGVPRQPAEVPLPTDVATDLVRGYLACTSYVDAQVGRLLAALDELGLAENTIVVLWGDHGWKLGEYGQWSKNSNFDIDTRVPLIIRAPRLAPGARNEIVELVDLYPTLTDLAGLPRPGAAAGESFAALLRGEGSWRKAAAFSEVIRNPERSYTTLAKATAVGQSVRTDRYRFVRWLYRDGHAPVYELYDARQPNGETVNVAGDPAYAADCADLARRLDAILQNPFAR